MTGASRVGIPSSIGVVGAGTMGRGIALLGALANLRTHIVDTSPVALQTARRLIDANLDAGLRKGVWDGSTAQKAIGALHFVDDTSALADCGLIVEAVPEEFDLKVKVLSALPGSAVLATNTSSLSIAAIASRLKSPGRLVGMHFFNPPTRIRLVEIIGTEDTDAQALETATAVATAMDRVPVRVRDSLGFVVNRCARPFYGEALQLSEEGVADVATIDRICRVGGGFRMGPFELMDLIGLDTHLAVSNSFFTASFGVPRWRPSRQEARLVAAGALGRKSGRGWYDYSLARTPTSDSCPPGKKGEGRSVAIVGDGPVARGMRGRAGEHGFVVHDRPRPDVTLIIDAGLRPTHGQATLTVVTSASLAGAARPTNVGCSVLPPVEEATLVELTSLASPRSELAGDIEDFMHRVGLATAWVDDAPGLVLARIVCQLVNEAFFAAAERVASPEDVDAALRFGLNHPRGPFEWGRRLGWKLVVDVLDGLWDERRDPRYRAAPLLRRAAVTGEVRVPGVAA